MERVQRNGLVRLAPDALIQPAPNLLLRRTDRLPNATSASGHGASFKVQDLRTNLAFLNKADPFLYAIKLDDKTVAYWTDSFTYKTIWDNGKQGKDYASVSDAKKGPFRIGNVLFASNKTLQRSRIFRSGVIEFKYNGNTNQAMCLSKGDQIVNITSFEDFKAVALQEAMNEDVTSDPAIIVCDLVS